MNQKTQRILLIENDAQNGSHRDSLLKGVNGFIIEAHALKAMDMAPRVDSEIFSAVVMDVNASFEQRLALLRQVREGAPSLPIILLTDEGNPDEAAQMLHAGAQDYLVKSWVQRETIPWAIQNAIERHHLWFSLQKKSQEYETNQHQLQVLIEKNADGILIVDPKGQIQFANPAAERLFDTNKADLIGADFGFPVLADDTIEIDIWQRGEPCYAEMRVVDITWQGKSVFLVSLRDVTERVQTEKRMRHLATHDALTGLPNRILFFDRLHLALARAQRNHAQVAVLFLDLDRFKQVNDSYGHLIGDQVLQILSFRLEECLRHSDTVARMGGDEFTVILENIASPHDCVAVARKILEVVSTPFVIKKQEFHFSASIGISIYPDDTEDADLLLNHADTAMYQAKESRNQYRFFNPNQNAE